VAIQDQLDRFERGLQGGIVEPTLAIQGRESGRGQQRVALAQRHVEAFRQAHQHGPARQRAAGLDEADMAGGGLGRVGQVELGQAPALTPMTQLFTHGPGQGMRQVHGSNHSPASPCVALLRR